MDDGPVDLRVVESYSDALASSPDGNLVGCCWQVAGTWVICVPDASDTDFGYAAVHLTGWAVTGDAPRLTVHPSIDVLAVGGWHGWVKDGRFVLASWNTAESIAAAGVKPRE